MRSVQVLGLLLILFMSVASAACAVPDRSQESEQRIASMEINQSAGNMTGDDYVIALIYAYMQDVQNSSNGYVCYPGPIFSSMENEALLKFPEYENVYLLLDNGRGSIDTRLTEMNIVNGIRCKNLNELPESNIIYVIQYVFNENEDVTNKARVEYQTRIAKESELKAMKEKRETEQLSRQQENAARQTSLDAYYKNASENYSTKIADLLNQSNFNEALNLSNESISALVSPYSNIMMITQGDIYMRLGRYQDAIESYNSAQTDFKYSNESAEYKNSIRRDFVENKWDRIVEMKIGIAKQNISEQIDAKIHDMRDAPDAKRLLVGHDQGRRYTVGEENYTFMGKGYVAFVNVSAYDDPKATDVTKYMETNIPMCIDMFAALFSDEKISNVRIQTNESYFDKFGHIKERPFMIASLDNATAMQIGDWAAFKQYVGMDVSKFEQVIDLKMI